MSNIHARLPRLPAYSALPTTKAELLDRMRAERSAWDGLLNRIPAPLLTRAVLADGWSVKDLMAHIAAYEQWTAANLAAASAGLAPTARLLYGVDELPPGAAAWTVDQQNAFIHALYAAMPMSDVAAFAARAFTSLVEAVSAVPEAALRRPGAQAWTGPATLLDVIPAQSYEHYQQHLPDLQAVVTGVAPVVLARD